MNQHSCKTYAFFYFIIHFIRSRINSLDLIIGNMASDDEGQGSGDCNVYEVANAYLNLLDEQWLLQGPTVPSETETDMETGAETETSAETGAETGRDWRSRYRTETKEATAPKPAHHY
jgi:hypothetical protein